MLISIIPCGVFPQDVTLSNSVAVKSLFNYNESMGIAAGFTCLFPISQSVDFGLGYQYTVSTKSPKLEQYVATEELTKIHHFTQNEFSLFAHLEIFKANFYQLKLKPGLLINSYCDGFIVHEYYIDADTGFKAYASAYHKGVNLGLNASVINVFKVSDRVSISLLTGISFYRNSNYNSFTAECEIAYRLSKNN